MTFWSGWKGALAGTLLFGVCWSMNASKVCAAEVQEEQWEQGEQREQQEQRKQQGQQEQQETQNEKTGIETSDSIRDSQSHTNNPAGELPIKYWGNSFSLKFHRPSCPFAKAMSAHHVMFFNFRKQAVESGQVPCRYCLPPSWTVVRASIWHPVELPAKSQRP